MEPVINKALPAAIEASGNRWADIVVKTAGTQPTQRTKTAGNIHLANQTTIEMCNVIAKGILIRLLGRKLGK